MHQCIYSIIPAPKRKCTCSSCGKEIEDLPNYTQIANVFACTAKKGDMSFHLGFGLGVPMCDKCDTETTETHFLTIYL